MSQPPGNLRVGDITQSGDERVVGHKLSDDGKVCETLYEPTTVLKNLYHLQIRQLMHSLSQLSQQQVRLRHQLY